MASLTFHRELPTHLSRIRIATFQQLVGYLLSSKYTAEQYPALKPGDRERLARSDVADAVKRGKESGQLVVDKQVVARGDNPRPVLAFDSSTDGEILPAHYQRLLSCSRRVGRKRVEAVYSLENSLIPVYAGDGQQDGHAWFARFDEDCVTAELIVSSIYFGSPEERIDGWKSWTDSSPPGFFQHSEGWEPPPCVVPFAASARLRELAILVPVLNLVSTSDEQIFLNFVRHYIDHGYPQLQIWMPDPESVLP